LNTVSWNLRGRSTSLPRSPSEVRDSIAIEKRLTFVVDSLEAAGTEREELDRVVEQLRGASNRGFGGFSGGTGAGAGQGWVERPAEGRPVARSSGSRSGEPSLQQRITQLVRGTQSGRGRRFGGGGLFPTRSEPATPVDPGTYTVVLTIGERTFTQPLTVGRSENAPSR
jgi:hypothetical protein